MKKIDRLAIITDIVDSMLKGLNDDYLKRCGYVHLYGVSKIAYILALKRDLDTEIAAIMGLCHDYYSYKTGLTMSHAHNSAEALRPILRDLEIFTKDEQILIYNAIFKHGRKKEIDSIYDEVIKDADTLDHYLASGNLSISKKEADRLERLLKELALPRNFKINAKIKKAEDKDVNKRKMMVEIALMQATKDIIGERENKEFQSLIKYWTGNDVVSEFTNNWCAAFVYDCCYKATIYLPMKYPNTAYRFACVRAWVEWAKLEEIGFYHDVNEKGYEVKEGDIVIYNQIISNKEFDHIGIVVKVNDQTIDVAEGNMDNKNCAGIIIRRKNQNIAGYIRIKSNYKYNPSVR